MIQNLVVASALLVPAVEASINLVVVGDWGGIPFPPYHTPAQTAVAKGMGVVGAQIEASAVISLGDNFYFDGIATDAGAKRFEETWNSVYDAPSLQVPWYIIAGNHDHYGNVTAEVEHTNVQTGGAEEGRWQFPSLYYTKTFTDSADGTTMDIIFIDTIDLSGNTVGYDENTDGTINEEYFAPLPYKAVEDAAEQWAWIEATLAASTADYVFVAGHFPVYSVCSHGNTGNLLDNLRPMLIKYGAHYMAGHDHCLVSTRDEHDLLYLVSGAGNTCCTKDENLDEVPAEYLQWYISDKKQHLHGIKGGFSSIVASKEAGLVFSFYDQTGEKMLHATEPVFPRTEEQRAASKAKA